MGIFLGSSCWSRVIAVRPGKISGFPLLPQNEISKELEMYFKTQLCTQELSVGLQSEGVTGILESSFYGQLEQRGALLMNRSTENEGNSENESRFS